MKHLWKEVYAALEVKHIAFKMYKGNNDEVVFEFMNNKIVLSDNDNIAINNTEYSSVQDAVSFIKNY